MICPFCKQLMLITHTSFFACKNHDAMFLCDEFLDDIVIIAICKDGSEIACFLDEKKTYLRKWTSDIETLETIAEDFFFNGFCYDGTIEQSIAFDALFELDPNNFDKLFHKLQKLIPFS